MRISTKDWLNYINRMRKINDIAAEEMQEFIRKNGFSDTEAIINRAYALATKYGEGTAELAAEMYEAIAEAQGAMVPPADPAPTSSYGDIAKAINGSLLQSPEGKKLTQVVGRHVKLPGADTMLKNAIRDGAEFAWVPFGDTCAFCITLASRGWQKISKKALKKGHAEHIHANCDCQYCVRFDSSTTVEGYDPDALLEEYNFFDGSPSEKINAMRRARYAERKDQINVQKRAAYTANKQLLKGHVHFKTGELTTEEYIKSKNPLSGFVPVSKEKAVPSARSESQKWIDSINGDAKQLISRYTYNQNDTTPKFYERINSFIRNGYTGDRDYTEKVEIISNALKQSKLANRYMCYRGSDYNPFEDLKVGERGTAKQFLSTSLASSGSFGGDYSIVVFADKGTNAAYIESLSHFKKQREMLFDKDVVYELLYKSNDAIIVRTIP